MDNNKDQVLSNIPGGQKAHYHHSRDSILIVEDDRTGMDVQTLKRAFIDNLYYLLGKDEYMATPHDLYMALSYTVRDRLIHRWIRTKQSYINDNNKIVCYLSAEFLMGRQLQNNLINLGLYEKAKQTVKESSLYSLDDLIDQEAEPGLGNGGLGRLAACFLDSLSSLQIPSLGYGIRYEFGIFEQAIKDGWQVEKPDRWLLLGNPWEIPRPENRVEVKFGGHTRHFRDSEGRSKVEWIPDRTIVGTPYDTLIPGYQNNTVNTLRLWSAKASEDFNFEIFNAGDYTRAVSEKMYSENISKVLYPNDNLPQGKELRLKQQFFFVTCSLQDIIRLHLLNNANLDNLADQFAIQLNDTHPSVSVAELMRLLVDEHNLEWDKAWEITQKAFGYTNHTLLPEALEKWPVSLFQKWLPRHLEIIYEINVRFLEEVKSRYPNDSWKVAKLSLIEEGREKQIRMAHLACVGSHKINGVASLHTDLLKHKLLKDFYELWPTRFTNKTNGVTPRRWILQSNPLLSELVIKKIGTDWITKLDEFRKLEEFVDDPSFCEHWASIKFENKKELAGYIREEMDIEVDPNSLFDVQVKRIHEYKRQLLNALFIVSLYNKIKKNKDIDVVPRTFIFGGKAAPGYFNAKLIIKLINSIAEVVNNDPDVNGKIKVIFLPNFCVSLGEFVYPAADLSEQISTAGKEASGTGNMKFAMNGALTVGTLDGANIEILEAVGEENIFIFGLKAEQVFALNENGYNPMDYYHANQELKEVIDAIANGVFSQGDREIYKPIIDSLIYRDEYKLMIDFSSYLECQSRIAEVFKDKNRWTKMSILNAARMGYFSSDRTIQDYCDDIWNVKSKQIELNQEKDRPDVEKIRQIINSGTV
ncbi:MAG: glycogen/starch/alpha-glucan phosphorylase [Candidatus Caenarcaniphilales bacterium]|nr:glycogen/starch/alpha-glucan phosphorylase [Candidatus Caenarcaniphilales bacterium]